MKIRNSPHSLRPYSLLCKWGDYIQGNIRKSDITLNGYPTMVKPNSKSAYLIRKMPFIFLQNVFTVFYKAWKVNILQVFLMLFYGLKTRV